MPLPTEGNESNLKRFVTYVKKIFLILKIAVKLCLYNIVESKVTVIILGNIELLLIIPAI